MTEFSASKSSQTDPAPEGTPGDRSSSIVFAALFFYGALGAIALAIVWLRGASLGFASPDARPIDWLP